MKISEVAEQLDEVRGASAPEVVEFSPTKQLRETLAVVERNMADAG
jgi:hypothetical protein